MLKQWIVFVEPPKNRDPAQMLKYLARYVYQTAISDSRIRDVSDTNVTIGTRGENTLALPGGEFVRRFALHVLPSGFRRVRHYGLLAPSARCALALAADLAHYASPPRTPRVTAEPEPPKPGVASTHRCPDCGAPVRIFVLERQEMPTGWPRGPP
jgi:hypothetical protein